MLIDFLPIEWCLHAHLQVEAVPRIPALVSSWLNYHWWCLPRLTTNHTFGLLSLDCPATISYQGATYWSIKHLFLN